VELRTEDVSVLYTFPVPSSDLVTPAERYKLRRCKISLHTGMDHEYIKVTDKIPVSEQKIRRNENGGGYRLTPWMASAKKTA
jgi:hypothetical protein